jgi:hypothetical protein
MCDDRMPPPEGSEDVSPPEAPVPPVDDVGEEPQY